MAFCFFPPHRRRTGLVVVVAVHAGKGAALEIHTASRGAARLRLYGNRSHDNNSSSSSDAVTRIAAQHWHIDAHQPSTSQTYLSLNDDTASALLSAPTLPVSASRLSLQSHVKSEPTSADTNALAANTFLQRCHPELDLPHWLVSEVLFQNAKELQSSYEPYADSLDTPLGLAATLLGPIVVSDSKTKYFILSIGGVNRNQLLVHLLHVSRDDADTSGLSETAQDKQKEASLSFDFHPAYRPERSFDTPILQLAACSQRHNLVVRTHSSTHFFRLHEENHSFLKELRSSSSVRHVDVCFSPTDSNVVAAIASDGHIEIYHLPSHTVRRFTPESADEAEALRRVCFGVTDDELFVLSARSLYRITVPLEDGAVVHAHKFVSAPFCLATKRAGRFYSLSLTSMASLLAVCSSELVHWFDVQSGACQPLFSTAHHRGDDASLTLTPVPARHSGSTARVTSTWVLSSLRNRLLVAYTVHTAEPRYVDQQAMLIGSDLVHAPCSYVLDNAPVDVPTQLPDTTRPGSAAVLFDLRDALQLSDPAVAMLEFTDRGAIYLQLLRASEPHAPHVDVRYSIQKHRPMFETSLYREDDEMEEVGPNGGVETRILPLQNVYAMVMSDRFNRSSSFGQDAARMGDVLAHASGFLLDPDADTAALPATVVSLGQIVRQAVLIADDEQKDLPVPRNALTAAMVTQNESVLMALRALQMDLYHVYGEQRSGASQQAWLGSHGQYGSEPFDLDAFQRQVDSITRTYLSSASAVSHWSPSDRKRIKDSLEYAGWQMVVDAFLETQTYVCRRVTLLDKGDRLIRPQPDVRRGTTWTPAEHRDKHGYIDDDEPLIPPPYIGPVGLSFFHPLKHASQFTGRSGEHRGTDDEALESLLPSTSTTARLLLSEWQVGEDPSMYVYSDPYDGLHRLPRVSRSTGPTVRARSRSFSLASSGASAAGATGQSHFRAKSKDKRKSATPAPSSIATPAAAAAPPALVSSKRRRELSSATLVDPSSASNRVNTPAAPVHSTHYPHIGSSQRQPPLATTNTTPAISSSQLASTQIEPGKYGARKPKRKKPRASGF